MTTVTLPHDWRPRAYQRALWTYLERGGTRAVGVWHRRAGKDELCLHWAAVSAFRRIGTYWHMLPQAAQARKAIWDAVNPHTGRRRIDDAFPAALRATTREQEMLIRFKNGSTWQVVGSDNYNSLVGAPPVGVVFSEFALADPASWSYLRPILAENGGWAVFISTPRGRNHFASFYEGAARDPDWFAQRLRASETGVFTPAALARELAEYRRDYGDEDGQARFDQEFEVSFDAAIVGAYYGRPIQTAEAEGRIGNVGVDPRFPVHTAWDLGMSDSTAIWFFQVIGREIRLVDYLEAAGVGLDHYARALADRGYLYGEHLLPHDAAVRELGTGKSRIETLSSLGLGNSRIVAKLPLADGIHAVRALLPRCWFDAVRCERGLSALRQHRREWSDGLKTFMDRPLHDWTSHGADAFRYLAVGVPETADGWGRSLPVDTGYIV